MSGRQDIIAAFLQRAGWGEVPRQAMPGDASFRRYHRLTDAGRRALLMDAPPPQEDVRPFLAVARLLQAQGFSAPAILAEDVEAGLLLLEDFGDGTYTRLLAAGASEEALYALAVDVLIALHRGFEARAASFLPAYDDERLLTEALLLPDWYLPAVTGRPTPGAVRDAYIAAWREVLPLVRRVPQSLVLRDYHVDNLMRLDGRDGVAACGLLDFQDAVLGPVAYDLVSLLEDARRDVPVDVATAMRARYLAAFPTLDRADFDAAYAVLGAQRNCKIVGIFTRLRVRDGKPVYLPHIPRLWRLIAGDMRHATLQPVARWLDANVPPALRLIPEFKPAA